MVKPAVPEPEKISPTFCFLKSILWSPWVKYKLTSDFTGGSGAGGGFSITLFLLQLPASIIHTSQYPTLLSIMRFLLNDFIGKSLARALHGIVLLHYQNHETWFMETRSTK
jgi:hypothetical protein